QAPSKSDQLQRRKCPLPRELCPHRGDQAGDKAQRHSVKDPSERAHGQDAKTSKEQTSKQHAGEDILAAAAQRVLKSREMKSSLEVDPTADDTNMVSDPACAEQGQPFEKGMGSETVRSSQGQASSDTAQPRTISAGSLYEGKIVNLAI
ncbi:unnamed protein product, partial [Amoebophrya sp. A25]